MSVRVVNSPDNVFESDTDISSVMDSCQFLKKIIPTAMATILYRRCEFDPNYIKKRTVREVPYVGFRSTIPKQHCAYKLLAYSNIFEGLIENKQLKEVFIQIEDRATQKVQERYVFSFNYSTDDDDDDTPEAKSQLQSQSRLNIAAKFFDKINTIPNNEKYPEDSIQIQIGCQFYENIPREVLNLNFKPAEKSMLKSLMSIGSLKTNFHQIQLLCGCAPSERVPNEQSEILGEEFGSAQSNEFADLHENVDSQLLQPIRVHTPKPRSKIIKKMLKRRLVDGLEPLYPLTKSKRLGIQTPSTSGHSGSDLFSDDLSEN